MYNYGNKSTFDYDQGLKVLLRLDETDDFYYNQPVQGAHVSNHRQHFTKSSMDKSGTYNF